MSEGHFLEPLDVSGAPCRWCRQESVCLVGYKYNHCHGHYNFETGGYDMRSTPAVRRFHVCRQHAAIFANKYSINSEIAETLLASGALRGKQDSNG
jgi:hypothetical protein